MKSNSSTRNRNVPRYHARHRAIRTGLTVATTGAAVAMLLAACGSTSTPSATKSHPSATSSKHITLTELDDYPKGLPQWAAYQWLFSTYEKSHPNVTIDRESVSGTEILPKLLAEAQTHTMPDIAVPDNPDMPSLEATHELLNLKPDITKWGKWSSYLAGSRAVESTKSGIYGIQIGTNDLAIIYNKKLFAEAGITQLPKTWSELIAVSKQLVDKVPGLTYRAIGLGGSCGGNWQLLPYIYQQGININNLTAPGVAAAVNLWKELLSDGLASKEMITQCQSTNIPQLVQGKLAMVEDGPWDFPTLAADHFSDWGDFPIPLRSPSDKYSVPLGGENWVIPKTSPAIEAAAWDFLEWSQQPKILFEYDQKLGYISVRPQLWPEQEKADPKLKPLIEELPDALGRTTTLGASFVTYSTDLNTALIQVLEGQKNTSAALADAEKAAKASLRTSG